VRAAPVIGFGQLREQQQQMLPAIGPEPVTKL
jgi:hypothetical protein